MICQLHECNYSYTFENCNTLLSPILVNSSPEFAASLTGTYKLSTCFYQYDCMITFLATIIILLNFVECLFRGTVLFCAETSSIHFPGLFLFFLEIVLIKLYKHALYWVILVTMFVASIDVFNLSKCVSVNTMRESLVLIRSQMSHKVISVFPLGIMSATY